MAKTQITRLLSILLLALTFITIILQSIHSANSWTQDLGRHLKLGEIILNTNNLPRTNLFSYTFPDYPFINHHWLAEVIFYLIFKTTSNSGLVITKIIILSLAFLIPILQSQKNSSLPLTLLMATLVLPIYLERTDIRPEIFCFLLLSLLFYLLENARPHQYLVLTPLIMVLAINLHIYFAALVALIIFFTLDKIAHRQRPFFHCAFFFLACLSLLITPNGIKHVLHPLSVLGKSSGYQIVENQSPFFLEHLMSKDNIIFLKLSLIISFISIIYLLKKKRFFYCLSLIFFTLLAILQIRNFPLYALILIPISSFSLFQITKPWQKKRFYPLTLNLLLLSTLLFQICSLITFIHPTTISAKVNSSSISFQIPNRIDTPFRFFQENQLKGPIFNNFDIAGLIIYYLYPQEKVFVDNRPETYPIEFFQATYIPMQQNPALFKQIDDQYQFQTIIFSHTDITPWAIQFLSSITNNPEWSIVYLDERIVILVKNSSNPSLVSNFAITPENAKAKLSPLFQTNDANILARLQHFFNIIGWSAVEQYTSQKLKFI